MTALGGIRTLSVCSLALSLLLTAACTSSAPSQQGQGLPSNCTQTITRSDDVRGALDAAAPGSTVCFTGGDLTDADVTMTKSGTPGSPIKLIADGAPVENIHITASHVVVQGFTVAGGDGMELEGTGITAQHNTIHDTRRGGIACTPCSDSTIDSNTVQHVSTVGIFISGQRITVSGNTVSETVAEDDGDADGMRFFGTGHRITGNTIHDISARGYRAPPHPDCFQTFDHSPPTYDVVISGNTCQNVDAQCLIATDDQPGSSGSPNGVPSITFADNTCAPNGAQAINLRRWPNVEIRHNKFSGPNLNRAILIIDGSTGCTVIDNTTAGGVPTVDVDGASRSGFRQNGNSPA
ncbi:MAG TPA: right-handed parallel beta-helix repeat-containing protein [Pseudonocardiaceae bacterium]|nr:right-handed parallel beta-helix repeat-containing protein [Pseudonocardiaceae bacterium]